MKPLQLTDDEKEVFDAAGHGHVENFEGPDSCRIGYIRFTSKTNTRLVGSGDRSCYFAPDKEKPQFGLIQKLVLIDDQLHAIIKTAPVIGSLADRLTLDTCPQALRPSFAAGYYATEYRRIDCSGDAVSFVLVPANRILGLCMFVEGPNEEMFVIRLHRHFAHD